EINSGEKVKIINRIDDKNIVSLSFAELVLLKSCLRLVDRGDAWDIGNVVDTLKYLEVIISDYKDNKK
ncbi:MAG: hypothetical protein Q8M94_21715, partial [Ignavibacteria bacterium]|nr:hypothetical protein [Ignavibacteria bacterium]